MSRHHTKYAIVIPLLLLFWGLRLPLVNSIPPFIDEAVHIEVTRVMLETSLLYNADTGKLAADWYWLIFQVYANAAFPVMRIATLLLVVLGAAASFQVGRMLGGTQAGIWALFLVIVSPYHTFYSALSLSDPVAIGFLMVALASICQPPQHQRYLHAALTGTCLALAAAAKVAYLPYAVLPILAALTLHTRYPVQQRLAQAARALVVFGVGYGAFIGVQVWRGYNPFGNIERAASAGGSLLASLPVILNRMVERLWLFGELFVTYNGITMLIVAVIAAGVLIWQRRFFLIGIIAVPGLTVFASSLFFSRYFYLHYLILLVMVAVVIAQITRQRRWWNVGVAVIALIAWIPFYTVMLTNPTRLTLPEADYIEYFAADSSGSGLDEIQAFLESSDADRVIGLLPNCLSLHYMMVNSLTIDCPRINPNGEDIPQHEALVESNRAPGVIVIHENSPYVPADIPGEALYTVERPGGLSTLTVYDLTP